MIFGECISIIHSFTKDVTCRTGAYDGEGDKKIFKVALLLKSLFLFIHDRYVYAIEYKFV